MVTRLAKPLLVAVLRGATPFRKDTPVVHNAMLNSPEVAVSKPQVTRFLVPIQAAAVAIDLHRSGLHAEETQGVDATRFLLAGPLNEVPIARNGRPRNPWSVVRPYVPVSETVLLANRTVMVGNGEQNTVGRRGTVTLMPRTSLCAVI